MAMKPIALSFKNTAEDSDLYKWITSHSNLSGFIKDILRAAKDEDIKQGQSQPKESKNKLLDLDF